MNTDKQSKKRIYLTKDVVNDLQDVLHGKSISDTITYLQETEKDEGSCGFKNLRIHYSFYYDYHELKIIGDILETDLEYKDRQNKLKKQAALEEKKAEKHKQSILSEAKKLGLL